MSNATERLQVSNMALGIKGRRFWARFFNSLQVVTVSANEFQLYRLCLSAWILYVVSVRCYIA